MQVDAGKFVKMENIFFLCSALGVEAVYESVMFLITF